MIKTRIVQIGNSKGIRLPKAALEQSQLAGEVELVVADRSIIIRSPRKARDGWDEAFRELAHRGDDAPLLSEHTPNRFDESEWTW